MKCCKIGSRHSCLCHLSQFQWQRLLTSKPIIAKQDKIDDFISYFYSQWMTNSALCSIDWNHFDKVRPRTNNHVEGFHHKLGEYIDNDHPNIYSLIETFKNIELSCVINYNNKKRLDTVRNWKRR